VTVAHDIASFVARASFRDVSLAAKDALKIRVLDALGCAFGALDAEPIGAVRAMIDDFGARPLCTLIGGGQSAPDRAALYNGALVRYLDFNDSYLAPRETCHPSDNIPAVLAAAEYARATGADLMTALAVTYQVHCRLSDEAPVRDRGFDHVTQGAIAAAAGVSRALDLSLDQTTNAIAIAAATAPALRVTRTGALSNWKGLAAPHAAAIGSEAAFLARHGVTGPLAAFEGNKGFMEVLSGRFAIDWAAERLDAVLRTSVKRYDAEVHAQSAVEAIQELIAETPVPRDTVNAIEVEIFDVAHRIIGGGEEGEKMTVHTKEEADHSLPYMIAVALLDGRLGPDQYAPERIGRDDVQRLLRRVVVKPAPDLSARFPNEHPVRVRVELADGRVLAKEKSDYLGFFTRPMSWDDVRAKIESIPAPRLSMEKRDAIASAVAELERGDVETLCALLGDEERDEVTSWRTTRTRTGHSPSSI
jgi:2-methylcitrate dehydratase